MQGREQAPRGTILLIILVAWAMFLNYADRGTISIAAPELGKELGLSATQFGFLASAFFWTYAPMQLVAGWLCDRFSVYRLFGAGMLICAISTALVGIAGGLGSLIVLRVLLGLGESVAFPGSSKLIARHVPTDRRGLANSTVAAALSLGPGLGTLLGGFFAAAYGWRAMFLFFGLATLVWIVPWMIFNKTRKANPVKIFEEKFPIESLVKQKSLWSSSIGHLLGNLTLYFTLTWLPLYLVQARGLSIETMTILVTSVYAIQALTSLFIGWLSDKLVSLGLDEGTVRKRFVALGLFGVAGSSIGIPFASGSPFLLVCLLGIGAFQGFNGVNIFAIAQMFAGPSAAGTWVGIQNTISNFAGIIGPILTGIIIDAWGGFTGAFAFTAVVGLVGAVWWLVAIPKVSQVNLD